MRMTLGALSLWVIFATLTHANLVKNPPNHLEFFFYIAPLSNIKVLHLLISSTSKLLSVQLIIKLTTS